MKYRLKTVVEAIQWTGDNLKEVQDFGKAYMEIVESSRFKNRLALIASDGVMYVFVDDWVIKDLEDEDEDFIYPCKPSVFEQTYELMEEA